MNISHFDRIYERVEKDGYEVSFNNKCTKFNIKPVNVLIFKGEMHTIIVYNDKIGREISGHFHETITDAIAYGLTRVRTTISELQSLLEEAEHTIENNYTYEA